MQTRLVLWGENAKDEKILVALDLLEDENQVELWTFPHSDVPEEFYQLMMNEWRFGKAVSFPESTQNKKLDINLSDSLLPADIKVDNVNLVNRAKAEWQFVLASNKMFKIYHSEVEDLMDKASSLSSFSEGMWDEMKAYWSKVQKQITDRNLYGSHADTLRKKTDSVFDKLKELRKKRDKEFRDESGSRAQEFFDSLDDVEKRIEKGLSLKPIFEELKDIQKRFNKTDMIRDHKNSVFNRIDSLFKKVKKGLFGEKATKGSTPLDKMKRRYDGLLGAIKKMKRSIKRDEDDLFYENKRKENSYGQLEDQLREAKLIMIQERLNSKRNKLEDMHKTRENIESRLKNLLEKEKEKEKQAEIEAAKKAAAAQIKQSIAEKQENINDDELKKAAATILGKTPKTEKSSDTVDDLAAITALTASQEEE